jgi:hypothetical protein
MASRSIWGAVATGLKWAAKVALVLVFVAAFLVPLILMSMPETRPGPWFIPTELSVAWLGLVALTIPLLIVYILWRIIRALVLYPFGSWQVFGATPTVRLVGLGIVTVIAPGAVAKLVLVPASTLLQLLERLPRQSLNLPVSLSFAPSPPVIVSIKEPLMQSIMIVVEVLAEVGRLLGQAMLGLLTTEVVIAIAMWAFVGQLLSSTVPTADGPTAGGRVSRLSQYIRAMSAAQRQGIVLTIVLLFGAYLSIAAIVAIPWLNEEKVSPGLGRDGLEKILNEILAAPAAQLAEPLKNAALSQEDPLAPLSAYLAKREKPANVLDVAGLTVNAAIADAKDARTAAIAQFKRMPAEIVERADRMRHTALSAFDVETATLMSNQERGYFMRQIRRSVTEDYGRLTGALQNCQSTLGEADKQFLEYSQETINLLSEAPNIVPKTSEPVVTADLARIGERSMRDSLLSIQNANARRAARSLRDACVTPVVQQADYAAPQAGAGWGPFGLVARWLLQTKSFALTLITGMLGFGLLGSAIATFVRAGTERSQTSLMAEVTSVLVRGLSAAVVVFLAVKGGLAIFSAGDNDPNAYVVFLTCLVGAVFSEDVWNWAHSKFLENLSSKATQAKKEQTMAQAIHGKTASGGPIRDESTDDGAGI